MSLINQMLKDLEARRRQQQPGTASSVGVVPSQQQPDSRSSKLLWLVVLIVVLVCGGAVWWYLNLQHATVPNGAQINVEKNSELTRQITPVVPKEELAQETTLIAANATQITPVTEISSALQMLPGAENSAPDSFILQDNNDVDRVEGLFSPAQALTELAVVAPAKESAVVISKPPTKAQQAQQLRLQAQRRLEQKSYGGAADLLQQALNTDDGSEAQWHQLTIAYLQAGQLPAACRAADAGCQRYPESSLLRVMQARLLLEMGKKEQALESLKFIAPPPITLSSDYYALLATLQQQNGDLVGALSTYQLLTAAFPQRGDWWIGSAICAEQLGKHQQAAIYYEQALRCSQLQVSLKQYALQQLQHLAKR